MSLWSASVAAMVVSLAIGSGAAQDESLSPPRAPEVTPAPCITVVPDANQAQDSARPPEPAQTPAPEPSPIAPGAPPLDSEREDITRPITDSEVAELLQLMAMVKEREGRPASFAVRATRERLRFVFEEATALLVAIHAEEAVGGLGSQDARADKEGFAALAARAAKVDGCVAARFYHRGGIEAYRESRQIIKRHQAAFQELLPLFRRWVPPRWPIPASSQRPRP